MKRLKHEEEPIRRQSAPGKASRFLVAAGVAALAVSAEGILNHGSPIPSAFTLR